MLGSPAVGNYGVEGYCIDQLLKEVQPGVAGFCNKRPRLSIRRKEERDGHKCFEG